MALQLMAFRDTIIILAVWFLVTCASLNAQQVIFQENFEYTDIIDFQENSSWSGDLNHFTLVEENGNTLLRLNAPAAGFSQISTNSDTAYGTWEFYYRPEAGPSNANRTFFFLVSDSNDFNITGSGATSNANGYVLRAGDNTGSRVFKLGRVVNGDFATTHIFLETETVIEQGAGYHVRVVRSKEGDWQIFLSDDEGNSLEETPSIVNENTFVTSSFFGMYVIYSGANTENFYYDNFIISQRLDGLIIEDLYLTRANQLEITFNHTLNDSTIDEASFSVDQGVGHPDSVEKIRDNVVQISFTDPFEDGSYTLSVNHLEDDFGQIIEENTEVSFSVSNPFDVAGIHAITSTKILVEFTEPPDMTFLLTSNFEISESGGAEAIYPQSIDYNPDEDKTTLYLSLFPALPVGDYSLTIHNLVSEFGWPLRDTNVFSLFVDNPFVVTGFEPLSRRDFQITFSQDIAAGADTESNYEITGIGFPESASLISGSGNMVNLQFAGLLDEGEYSLTISNLESLENWEIDRGTVIHFSLENTFQVASYRLAAPNLLEIEFTEPPDENDLVTGNFEVIGTGHPAKISYEAAMGEEVVTLEFDTPFFSGEYEMIIRNLKSDFGWPLPGESEFNFVAENPFMVTSFETVGRTAFLLTFSQDVDSFDFSDFEIAGVGSPDSAVLEENDTVRLTYNSAVPLGDQQLILSNIKSKAGWQIEPGTAISFFLFDEYEDGDLVISEFFYRVPVSWRTGDFQRPQYVEILNRTGKLLNLRNFTINGNNISIGRDLPIEGGEYLVIARGVPVFEQRFGERNFVEADQFPQLNLTTSGSIVFKTDEDHVIEELTYTAAAWGGNEVSLERYSFDVPSHFRDNWAESLDVLTGSPGLPNTITAPTDPPEAVSASFPEPRTLLITFSRTLTDESLQNLDNFSLNNQAIFTSATVAGDERTIQFKTEEKLEDQLNYTFNYQNIEDIFGNSVSGTQPFQFIFKNPFRILSARLVNEAVLRVQFTLPVNTSAVNLSDFQLADGIRPVDLTFPNSETVELTFSTAFDMGVYEVVVNNIESFHPEISEQWKVEPNSAVKFFRFDDYQPGDIILNEFMYRPPAGYPRYVELHNVSNRFLNLRNWELRRSEGASTNGGVISGFDLPIEPGGFVVLTPNSVLLDEIFGPGPWVQMNQFPGFTQTTADRIRLINKEGEPVEFVDYNPSEWGGNGVALERRSVGAPANIISNWGESEDEMLGTPGLPNSIGPDEEGPHLLTADFMDTETILVTFSGSPDFNAIGTSNFSINRGLSVINLEFINSVNAELSLNEPMISGRSYTITVNDIPDIFGNVLGQASASFTYYFVQDARPGDVVINEFMYNEPDGYTRYIELYNTSNRVFDIAGWKQANDTGTRRTITNDRYFFTPGSFLVLVPNETLLDIFPDIPFINAGSSLSALKNGGDEIVIANAENVTLDSLRYNPGWGGSGVALERIDVNVTGTDPNNWGESSDVLLGTPGKRNTVEPVDEGPELVSVDFIDERSVSVLFKGALNREAITSNNFNINRGRSVLEVSFVNSTEAVLMLDADMTSGATYTLSVSNIRDIFGNTLSSAQTTFTFYQIETAGPGDVVINEFMYNEPDDYTRYIELYNRSDKAFDLAGWRQANDTGTRRTLTSNRTILPPDSYIVILPNLNLLSIFPDIPHINAGSSLSALKTRGDNIVIANNEGTVIDSLRYSPDWGGSGVALERRRAGLSPHFPENWAESPNEMMGTPGAPNEVERDFNLTAASVRALNRRQVRVHFNSAIDENDAVSGNFSVGSTNPADVIPEEVNRVLLQFDSNLPTGHRTLTINNVQTPGGFRIAENSEFSFTVFDEFEPGDVVINEFMYRPPSGYARYVELFNNSGKLLNLRDWRLQRRQVSTEPRRIISSEDLHFYPGDYIVLTDDAVAMAEMFGNRNYHEVSNYPGFTVSAADQIRLFTERDVLADSLGYIPSTWGGNGVALERLSPDVSAVMRQNWAESPGELPGTPGLPNAAIPDTNPPRLLSAGQFENKGFILRFDKQPDRNSATNPSGYSVSPFMPISMIELNHDEVILFTGSELLNGQVYEILISGISDIFGNMMEPVTATVRYLEFGEAEPKQIVINEILYRRLQAGSPEFVEIYNRSDQNFDLSGWKLSDATGSTTIPDGTAILENDYLVFTDSPAFAAGSEKMIFLPGFRSLNNTGDAVVLRNGSDVPIDSVYYRSSWHNNPAGISLERKDPAALSIDPVNWVPSRDKRGSTPAEQNSQYEMDVTPPEIMFANVISTDSIEVFFNKFIDLVGSNEKIRQHITSRSAAGFNTERLKTRFFINGSEVFVLKYDPQNAHRIILDGSSFQKGGELHLVVENLLDFQGNSLPEASHPVAQPLSPGDLVINEIMFNPIADNRDGLPDQSEYIEIHNRRPYAISLEGIFLHDEPDENGQVSRIEAISNSRKWIPGGGYVFFYPEPHAGPFGKSRTAAFYELHDDLERFALRVNRATLSLPIAGRAIYLADSTHTTIDKVVYNPEWHNPNLVDTRGIALERINPDFGSDDPSNWGSNATLKGGTPGKKNSIFQDSGMAAMTGGISLEPNPFSPDGNGFEDNLFINYLFDEPDYLLRIRIFDRYGRLVRKLAEGINAGFEGTVIWDGRTDSGQKNRIGIYIVLVEAYNSSSGRNLTFKETAVLATQF